MKRFLITVSLLSIIVLSSTMVSAYTDSTDNLNCSPTDVRVLINGKQLTFDQEPLLVKDRILVPLRKITESLGAIVKWDQGIQMVTVQKGNIVIGLNIDSDVGFKEPDIIFTLEQPPILVNGRTMVSLRFLAEGLGTQVSWDEKSRTVYISEGDFMKLDQPVETDNEQNQSGNTDNNNYYKFYHEVAGEQGICPPEEAKTYVLKQNLLKTIKDVQFTPTRFVEYGPTDTMVVGNDDSGREKAVWLTKSPYGGRISLTGYVLTDDGVSKEMVYSKLAEKGINHENVQKIYIAPYSINHIDWFVIAEQDGKKYCYCFDYKTGDIFIENILMNIN
ncbi:copper amine oxidase domain protein [Desulfofarcimen acetoxidans DSM 771]|uniref:Copper amine oxidase domain protein n=1 Tax=Desulfofarcimen acetoxidans (strain ATCC 49208 / DSM 771 / KCTC 5769 / VKM B-1644 / 5575) TaxID=485916 RepID=C8W4K6_DESAS|nr:copper amine oxidase N-terminal domain-containing protein [Desulfofarcimen acetoxidans]ACV63892.1 copper amine oxidase domain protein [Desulfofarcimen acetoxidans DSM 771]